MSERQKERKRGTNKNSLASRDKDKGRDHKCDQITHSSHKSEIKGQSKWREVAAQEENREIPPEIPLWIRRALRKRERWFNHFYVYVFVFVVTLGCESSRFVFV